MGKATFDKIKLDAAGLASIVFINAACFLLMFGGLSLAKDHAKVVHYVQTTCTVRSVGWRNVSHLQFFNAVERFIASWEVNYDSKRAVIVGTKHYIYSSSTLAEINKYKVNAFAYLAGYRDFHWVIF